MAVASIGCLAPIRPASGKSSREVRSYHVCLSPAIVENDPELVDIVRRAGVGTVWLAGFLYGHRPYSDDSLQRARTVLSRAGLEAQLITVPLGHPGNSLGLLDGNSPPSHWRAAKRPNGKEFTGTSLHAPATGENCAALRHLRTFGFHQCFLDDDFRLARSPGEIGGCFCADHRTRFLQAGGYTARQWDELLDDVTARRLTPLLRAWLDFTCDELTASFRSQHRAFRGDLGIMVMYLGAEKAGIRFKDYQRIPFRVGELMFDDTSFRSPKGKTDELFSVLFHRRFVRPEHAFSETTAYPADRLSAANMAAKLVISTLADVRHTMFMSGLTPFPRDHWATLGPAMQQQTALHELVAGHRPRGPFKHFWGEAQRMVGDDRPFSLWLATGVPFEVVEQPSSDGWTFLSDFDACELASRSSAAKAQWLCRPSAKTRSPGMAVLEESLPDLFAFKNRIRQKLLNVPHVAEDLPAVCAWYPTAGRVVVWNLTDESRELTVIHGAKRHVLQLGPLGAGSTKVDARATPDR
jgi:hypothetical protein